MATLEVSTWAELVAAFDNISPSEDTTIKLTADIDMNDTNPEGVTNSFSSAWWGRTLVIDGGYTDSVTGESKNHVIKNLRTPISGNGSIFYFYYGSDASTALGVKFQNIDFQNLILASGHCFDYDYIHIRTFILTLENCRFVGSRGNWYLIGRNPYYGGLYNCSSTLNKCYIDMPWDGAGQTDLSYTSLIPKDDSNNTNTVANYCRFKESYGGWTYSNQGYGSTPTLRVFSFSYFKCSGCRMEGSMTIPMWQCSSYGAFNGWGFFCGFFSRPIASYTPTAQNVFDVSLTCDDSYLVQGYFNKLVSYSGFSYLMKTDAKCKSDDSACTYTTTGASAIDGASYTLPIAATPAQMKDASYLQSQGFDIIVPSE